MTTLQIVNKILSIYDIKNPLIRKQCQDFGILFKDFQNNNILLVFKFLNKTSSTLTIYCQGKNEIEAPNSVKLIEKILN